jgi:hypothetical protein
MKSLIPPFFIKVPPQTLYDLTLPSSVHRTYEQIIGLCWQRDDDATPPLTVQELCVITGLRERRMWGHLRDLRYKGLLDWEKLKGGDRLVLRPILPGQEEAVDHTEENLAVLAEFGVDTGYEFPRQVAALSHVTPDLIRAWGMHYRSQAGIHNLPGLLLYTLQSRQALPQGKDPRGGRRVPEDDEGSDTELQVPLPEPLSDELRRSLRGLGWEGDLGEVAEIVARDGDGGQRVHAWVAHVEKRRGRYTNPAGFLRTALRGGDWPEEEQAHEPERGQPSWSENIGDRLDVV